MNISRLTGIVVAVFAGFGAAMAARAETPVELVAYVGVAEGGRFFMKVNPEHGNGESGVIEANYTVYAVDPNGSFRELWNVKGEFEREAFLSPDGSTLALVAKSVGGDVARCDGEVVALYRNGGCYRTYNLKDFVSSFGSLRMDRFYVDEDGPEVLRWYWRESGWRGCPARGFLIQITTLEGRRFDIDLRSGEISAGPEPKAEPNGTRLNN